MKNKGKNKGFTLIEVVIAIAILAIALAPLTANFIASSKMNYKSRKNLNATNLAQDIMEGIRGYSATDVRTKLLNANTATIVGSVLPSNATYTAADSTKTASYTDTFNEYKINDVTLVSGSAQNTYDVIVQMTPDTTVYKGEDMASIASIDQTKDAVYTMSGYSEDTEATALNILYAKSNGHGTEAALKQLMEREIKLEITKSGAAYSTTVTVIYSIKQSERASWGLDDTTAVYQSNAHNISKTEASVCPRSIYLYYTGLESANSTVNSQLYSNEKISILNQSENDITVYVMRTQSEADKSLNETYNSNYRCHINVEAKKEDGSYVDLTSDANNGKVILVTNARYNISHGEDENERNKKEDGTAITITAASSYYDRDRAFIFYNDTTAPVTDDFFTSKIKESTAVYPFTYIYNGYRKSDEKLLYKVKLLITDKDDNSKVLATYEGGTIN